MGGPKYERISSGEDERAPAWTTKRAVVALAACSAFAAYTAPHATKVAAVQSLYKVGHALETSAAATDGTLLAADVAAVEDCAACECDELESLGVLAADAGGATESPTAMDYWELFWTDGEFGSELDDSYVWWTNEELEGVRANVLVDTFGDSRGIDIDSNSTSIFFTVDGCIGRVEPDGLDLKEVFCYDVDDDPGSQMEGLALYEYDNKMYWVDKKRNTLYGAELEGNDGDYWVVSESFDEPIDVAVDERAAALYVVDNTGIYKMDQDGSDLTLVLSEADAGLANFGGLDVDATNRQLFFAAANQIYVADIFDPAASYAAVYQSLKSPMGVAVSPEENLLFFIDDSGVYRGDLEGSSDKTFVAEIQDARFCAVLSESAPTPAPTPVPTSRPSLEPTSAPSFPPTPVPVPSPTSAPSPQPTPEPSFMPTSEPTFLPTTYPSFAPSSAPTTSPTPLPTRHPSPAPTGAPSYAPSPNPTLVPVPEPTAVPTSLPTPQCWLEMNKCGYCDGSAGWECVGEAPPTFKPTPAPITPTGKPSERPVASPTAGPEPAPTASPVAAAKFVAPTSAPFATISFAGAPSAAPVAPTASPLTPTSGPTRDLVQYPTVGAPGAPTATYGTDPPTLMPLPDEQPPPHANQTHHQNRTSYPTLQGSSYAAPTFPGFAPTHPLHTGAPTLMPLPPGPPPPHANKTHHQTRTSYPTSNPTESG